MFKSLFRLLALSLVAALAACSQPIAPAVQDVQIVGADRTVELGSVSLLKAVVTVQGSADMDVTWSVVDDTVATVDADGLMTAVGLGSTTVTATSSVDPTKSDTAAITVETDPEAAVTVPATVLTPTGEAPAVGAGLLMADFDGLAIAAASVTEIMEGVFLGPLTGIGHDGSFTLELPFADDMPAELFAPADQFVINVEGHDDCTLTASDPTVEVSETAFQVFFNLPGIALMTLEGLTPGLAVSEFVDVDDPGLSIGDLALQAWVYAKAPVSVSTTGAGCAEPGNAISVDVDLEAGWNQVEWTIDVDEVDDLIGFNMRNSVADEVFVINLGMIL